jgi:hypothetical protein
MSEKLPARNRMGHVPLKESLPKRKNSGSEAGGGPARPPQQEKVNPALRLPDLSQISPDKQMTDDLEAYQKLARHLLRLAIEDVDIRADYETEANRTAAERNRASAISFFKGEWFKEICEGIGIPHSSAKRAAFK